MATIQIRDVPDEVHHTFRARAAAAGMSLQEYVRSELIRIAGLRSPAELVADVRTHLAREGAEGYSTTSSVEDLRADRDR